MGVIRSRFPKNDSYDSDGIRYPTTFDRTGDLKKINTIFEIERLSRERQTQARHALEDKRMFEELGITQEEVKTNSLTETCCSRRRRSINLC
jgi:hypothetical protein